MEIVGFVLAGITRTEAGGEVSPSDPASKKTDVRGEPDKF
jgi:hypothetical protein